jgi:2-dehydro-3-deoxyphosphogluconate aldolase/(4S)-4-hydroxy-2-oxoglutarate aldolase
MNAKHFRENPLLGILRGIEIKDTSGLANAFRTAGLFYAEVTLNTPRALDCIEALIHASQDEFIVGAGTVLSAAEVVDAQKAGARFIVSPVLVPEVIKKSRDLNLPCFPGAFSPQEIWMAWNAGAEMVKVFPASQLGPKYFSEIKGPFQNIDLLACGGVRPENASAYLNCGAAALAFGGSIFAKERLLAQNFDLIVQDIRALKAAIKKK